jgi:prevent-host-death family protein
VYHVYIGRMRYTNADITSKAFRDDIGPQLDRVQHHGEQLLITRNGRPAGFVVPVELKTEVDAYLRTERGLSHVSIQRGSTTTRLTRDELAASLRERGDSLHLGDDETCLRTADLDVLSTLLGELAASRTDSLAELAGDWSERLHAMVADAQDRVG